MLKTSTANAFLRYLTGFPVQRGKNRLAKIVDPFLRGTPIRSGLGPVVSARFADTTFWLCMGQYQSFIEKVVEPLEPGDVFIDVGANMGMFSLAASAKVGPSGLVLAFEPSLREYNELVRNLTLNAAHNVLPFRLGLGETTLATEMSVADESISGCNRIGILKNEDLSCSIQKAFLTSFDSLPFARLLSSSQRVFVKLDTEGHEYSALVGMSQFLRRSNVISIIAELDEVLLNRFGHSVQEVVDLLFDIGFVAASDVTVEHGDYWFQRRATEQHDRHAATVSCLVGD